MMLSIGLGSQDKQIWTTVTAVTPGGAPVDLTDSTVEWAFPSPGERPESGDWKTGTWTDGKPSYALTPADIPLTVGLWDVWIRITDSPQVNEERIDQFRIY